MANPPGGSFIPKRSTGKVTAPRAGRRVYIFSYITYVVFFGTLLSVVGIFFLSQQAKSQLQEYIVRVDQEQQSFNRGQLESIRELDSRLNKAEQILVQHAAPSVIFEALESVIVRDIQLNKFEYAHERGKGALLSLGGLTATFDALLFQREVIEQNSFLASADIIEVAYGSTGTEIQGANRQEGSSPGGSGEATVTFMFEDETILNSIGYTPRQNLTTPAVEAPTVEQSTSTDATESTESIE